MRRWIELAMDLVFWTVMVFLCVCVVLVLSLFSGR